MKEKRGLNNKKGQGFQLPFGMLFSIILIAVFIFAAFYAIKAFLGYRDCSQIGIFIDELQARVEDVWASSEVQSGAFTAALPSGIEYVCFADITTGNDAGWQGAYAPPSEDRIVNEIERHPVERNMFFYPAKNSCNMAAQIIGHINVTKIVGYDESDYENPYCIENLHGKVSMSIEKGYYESLVTIKRA